MNQIGNFLTFVKSNYFFTVNEMKFLYSFWHRERKQEEKHHFLFLPIADFWTLSLYSIFSEGIRSKFKQRTSLIDTTLRVQQRKRLPFRIVAFFMSSKWKRLYSVALRGTYCASFIPKETELKRLNSEALDSLKTIKDKTALVEWSYKGVQVGDLVYDTYLRYKPAATVDLSDEFLIELIEDAINIFEVSENLLSNNKFDAIFLMYSTYIQHGIIARIALGKNIPVFFLGTVSHLYKRMLPGNRNHTRDHFLYKTFLNEHPLSKLQREEAKTSLGRRFKGEIDPATFYMRSSAFKNDSFENFKWDKSKKYCAVIYLHCFFDSPHVYNWMLFPDFLEWLEFTFKEIKNISHTDFYVKLHPNAIHGNEEVINNLAKKYPYLQFLDNKYNNISIINAKPNYIVTIYGTVGHEMPFFDIPAICMGDNPHADFPFAKTFKSIPEFQNFLQAPETILNELHGADKETISDFYYMHNLYPFEGRDRYLGKEFPNIRLSVNQPSELPLTSAFVNSDEMKKLEDYLTTFKLEN